MKRRLMILPIALVLLALAGLTVSCEQAKAETREDGKIEVEFWYAVSGKQARSLNEIVDAFNAEQDKYVVKAIYQGSYQSLNQKLIASLYAGRQPAASMMYESWTTRFLRFGCLQPVQTFVEQDETWGEEDLNDLFPAFRRDNMYRLTKEGDLYHPDPEGEMTLATLPFNKSLYVLFVNNDLMNEVGYDEPPKTWDEMKDLAQRMTKRNEAGEIVRYGFATRPMIEAFTTVLFAADGNYMDENNKNFTFTSAKGEAALQFLVDLVIGENASGYIESDYLSNVFGQGTIGMYIGSTAAFPYNDSGVGNKFIWRAYGVPAMEGVEGKTLSQGTNVGIFRQGFNGMGKNSEEVQRGAWEFLKYLCEQDVTVKWAIDTGYMPVRRSAAEAPKMKEYFEKNPNFRNAFEQLETAQFEPKPIWWDNVRTIFQREIEGVLNGRRTTEEGLAKALEKSKIIQKTAGQ
ncbi:ABC transporter substrate-binding protein [bacterium]|nr:ABC transporter substrate-binding protein [bacterium]